MEVRSFQSRRDARWRPWERRFAMAKAELLQQQQQEKKKRSREAEEEEEHNMRCSIVTPPECETDSSMVLATSSVLPSYKDVEANEPAYSQLSQPVYANLLSSYIKTSSKRGSQVDRIMHELLEHGDSAQNYMQGSRSMKIDNWLLLDNLAQGHGMSVGAHIRDLQNGSKHYENHMSIKQHKKCGSFHLPRELHNFDTFKSMHDMWKDYIMQLFKQTGFYAKLKIPLPLIATLLQEKPVSSMFVTADLHGAILLVAECKITAFNGVSGIMIQETAETFGFMTRDNKFRVVPNRASVFIIQADYWRVILQGDKLSSRDLIL